MHDRSTALALRSALLLLLMVTGLAGLGSSAQAALDTNGYVKEIRTKFAPPTSSPDLEILLDGPQGGVWRASVDAARMGEAAMSGEDELRRATLDLYGEIASGVFGFGLGSMLSGLAELPPPTWISGGQTQTGWTPLLPEIAADLDVAFGNLRDASDQSDLIHRFASVYFDKDNRDLLRQYVGDRADGFSAEDAWANIAALDDQTNIVDTIAATLDVDPEDYPDVLEHNYQLLRFSRDPDIVLAVKEGIETSGELLAQYRSASGPLKALRKGSDAVQLVNTGPLDATLTYLDGDDELETVSVGANHTATANGVGEASDIKVAIAGLGTVIVPAGRFATTFWHDPIDAAPTGGGGYDFAIARVRTANDGTPPAASIAWDFGDGGPASTAAGVSANHAYRCPGTYTVKALTTAGLSSDTVSGPVKVADWWQTQAIASRTQVLPNGNVDFSVGGAVPTSNVTYNWQFNDGTSAATTRNATHAFTTVGLKGVNLTVTDTATGCSHYATAFVVVGTAAVTLPSKITSTYTLSPSQVYVLPSGGTEVAANGILRAGASTIVKGRSSDSLLINGRLELNGTAVEPTVLTSYDDDAYGGDTNGNGTTTPTSWYGVTVGTGGTVVADHATLARGVLNLSGVATLSAVDVVEGNVSVSQWGRLTSNGLSVTTSSSSVSPVNIDSSGNVLTDTTINAARGVYLSRGTSTIDGLSTPGDAVPVSMTSSAASSTLRRVITTATGARFEITSGDFYRATLASRDLPYRITTYNVNQITTRAIKGRTQVLPGVRLQVDPRVQLWITDGGELDLAGTPTAPVSFTAARTDSWWGIDVGSTGTLNAYNTKIAGAGTAARVDGQATLTDVDVTDGSVTVDASGHLTSDGLTVTAVASSGAPVSLAGGGNTLTDTTINAPSGLYLSSGTSTIEGLSTPGTAVPVRMTTAAASSLLHGVTAASGARFEIDSGDFSNTTLASTDLPYRITTYNPNQGSVRQVKGATEFGPGVRVQVDPYVSLSVAVGATFRLSGTATAPVAFEQARTTPWSGIGVVSGATLVAGHVSFAGTGSGSVLQVSGTAALTDVDSNAGSVSVASTGQLTSQRLSVTGLGSGTAVTLASAGNTLTDTTVDGAGGIAMSAGANTIDGLIASGSVVPVSMVAASASSSLRRVTAATGAHVDIVSGDLNNATLTGTDVPYRITTFNANQSSTRQVKGVTEVQAGVAVQVDPYVSLSVPAGATFKLSGTASAPIVFDQARTTAWTGINVASAANLVAEHARLRGFGSLSVSGAATLHDGQVVGNLSVPNGGVVDAARTWWGAATGPAPGQISGIAVTRPWCVDAGCTDVYPHEQTISFTSAAPSDAMVGDSYTVTATGGASGNPVVFSVAATSDSGACSVSTTGDVALIGVGSCVVAADQAGSTDHQPAARTTQSFSVGPREEG